MQFNLEIHGLEEIAENLRATLEQARQGTINGVRKVAEAARDAAQENLITAGAIDNGELLNSIHTTPPETDGDIIEAKVIAGAPYAQYVEFGTGIKGEENHAGIDPSVQPTYNTIGRTIRYTNRRSGKTVEYYIRGWIYPLKDGSGFRYTEGMPARPFLYPAKKMIEGKAKGIIAEEIRKVIHGGE